MSGKHRSISAGFAGLWLALVPCTALGQPAQPEGQADVAQTDGEPWQAEVDRLTGASLALQAEQSGLRVQLRESVADLNGVIISLREAAKILASPEPDADAARQVQSRIDQIEADEAQVERWLWGEEMPSEPGVTREALRARLSALRQEQANTELLIQAHSLASAFDREQLRAQLLDRIEQIRVQIIASTLPMRDRLEVLEAIASQERESFEEAMTEFGLISPDGPVAVEAVRADGWFQNGLVSFRWSDRRGQLVASARVRLHPSIGRDLPEPLLLDRFSIIAQTDQDVTVSVGYFSVEFRVEPAELSGEQKVLDALVRLLDLEALGQVQPQRTSPAQN